MDTRKRQKRKMAAVLAVCTGMVLFAGCGGENGKIYEQAGKDLEQGKLPVCSGGIQYLYTK